VEWWNNGIMEYRKDGKMEYWNIGILEGWKDGD
jgi:hypothetical protein